MRPRFSVAALMAFVLFVAVALASLREPRPVWAAAMFSTAVAACGVALLGTVVRRGARRAAWAGSFVFGAGYLTLCFGPGLDTRVMPRLLTTALIDDYYLGMVYAPGRVGEVVWVQRAVDQIHEEFAEGRVFMRRSGPAGPFDVA